MKLKTVKPTTAGRRHYSGRSGGQLPADPPRGLIAKGRGRKTSGRNSSGRITVRHRGGGNKRIYRIIDWKRNKRGIAGKVTGIEYDPNRSADIALVVYPDGDRRYILAPAGIKTGQIVEASETAPIQPGNALPISKIPVGTAIHNLELRPGKGGQMARSAGGSAVISARNDKFVDVLLPSGEMRRFLGLCYATIGQVGNEGHKSVKLGKAGRRRRMGWRPAVRGTAMNPKRHPHGGGEGRSGIGMKSPKSLWGKRTLGKKTRRKHYGDKWIIRDRRVKE
jgi:large subunit ribosomal protein L2